MIYMQLLQLFIIHVLMPGPLVVITDIDAQDSFNSTILSSDLDEGPRKFFNIKENTKGLTSEWYKVKKYRKLISKLLVASKGRQFKLRPVASQFKKWLCEKGYEWDDVSIDKIVDAIRICIRSIRELAKEGKQFPKGYPELKTLTEKVILDNVAEK